ncbi:MAG: LCP family protein [Chloroflexi bacterium]|nr:LCP family protein [Chloroflexota bacterium]
MRQAPPARFPLYPAVVLFCFLFGTVAGIATIYSAHRNPKSPISPILNPRGQFPGKDRINILVMGIDDNWTNKDMVYTKGARTDTLFVVSLDLANSKAYLLSIPRDSRVPIAGTRHSGKINGAYATGGVWRAVQTVANYLDVPIDYYAVLKIDATKNLVDSLGGVDLNVEKDMKYDDNWGHLHIDLKKGYQHLDGEQAVGYIRFRHDQDGDFGRIRRQQQLLRTIVDKLKNPMMFRRAMDLAANFHQYVDTDLDQGKLEALGMLFKNVSPSQIVSSHIPATNQRIGRVWFLIPDDDARDHLVDWLLRGDAKAEIPLVRVVVYNGCGSQSAVTSVTDRLKQAGFMAESGGDADRSDYATTQVIDHDVLKGAGALVVSQLGLSVAPQLQPDPQADASVELIVGRDLGLAAVASRGPQS